MQNNNPIFLPEDTQPPPPPPKPLWQARVKQLLRRKAVLIGGAIVVVITSMGTFLAISPTHETNNIVAQSFTLPTATPPPLTATPTIEATYTVIPHTPTPTLTPSPTLIPTPTLIPSTSWKTYANTQYGYSIKYSPDWIVKNLGELEPKIPSYIVFNPSNASASARFITISVTTRSYAEQLALGASSSAITVATIKGTRQSFQDSDGNISTVVVLPRTDTLLVLRAKKKYSTIFDFMLSTLKVTK